MRAEEAEEMHSMSTRIGRSAMWHNCLCNHGQSNNEALFLVSTSLHENACSGVQTDQKWSSLRLHGHVTNCQTWISTTLHLVWVYLYVWSICVCVKHMMSAASGMGCLLMCVTALSSAVVTVFEIYDSNVYSVTSRPSAAVIGKEPCCKMKM